MINVEGDYDAIVEWLDANTSPVFYVGTHGEFVTSDDNTFQTFQLNVGLFSLIDDFHGENECCSICHGTEPQVNFRKDVVYTDVGTYLIEDSQNSHKIVF